MAPDPDADTIQRLRMNHPGTVLKNYWRATGSSRSWSATILAHHWTLAQFLETRSQ